jgi:hypothetical protein
MNATTPILVSEQQLRGEAGTIALKRWQPSATDGDPVMVLPNGYGMLSYAESVCTDLAARGRTVYSLNARGQGGNAGEYSVPGAADDIAEAVLHVSQEERSFHLLVHCSAALPLIRMGADATFWQTVKSVVLYCYLAEPQAHLDRFRAKCEAYGVQLAQDVGRLDCYGPEAYNAIPVPLAVVHPEFPANHYRATAEQLRTLADAAGVSSVTTPEGGYDIKTSPQAETVAATIDRAILPLLV